ncbi:MAG: M14 metallopeptidase family protein [Spirosomataceae bacterium]
MLLKNFNQLTKAKIVVLLLLFLGLNAQLTAQTTYFLQNKKLNPAIPNPDQFLGYSFGSLHTRYEKIVEYMKELDRLSDRVSVQTIGKTNEQREQIIVTFTNPANYAKLEQIRKEHLELADPTKPMPDVSKMPVISWLGHNVHGNEPSGGESSIMTAYYLTASEDDEVKKWLNESVILMEPVINPDGRDRHSHWANMHKGTPPVADPNDREHNEVWPGGRTNHYWFDLNRDWYLATQVESQNRLQFYHKWLPNVVTDFHEMGTNSTHFFEPTKENAENPLVPKSVYRDLNGIFAKYFEKALNEIGSLYYTKESFDNLYPGYGSSYPDMEGGLGLLFEQASSRGHIQESQNGNLEYRFTVRNQFVNALATLRASVDSRELLLKHQKNFFIDVVKQANQSPTKAYIIGDAQDQGRNRSFWEMMLCHNVEFYHLQNDVTQDNITFKKGKAVVIPTNQPQYLMIRSFFDRPTTFADSLFYDASAWNLALAYGLPHAEIKGNYSKGNRVFYADVTPPIQQITKSDYAYLIDYSDYFAPKALYHLLKENIFVKVASKKFGIANKNYGYGTLIIPVKYQKIDEESLYRKLVQIQVETGVVIDGVSTGFSTTGIDLGSNAVQTVKMPQAVMLVGNGVTAAEAGEIWHLLDTRIGMPITKVEVTNFARLNLNKYTTLVMVGGNYAGFDKSIAQKIKGFVSNGGTLITLKTASEWIIKNDIVKEKLRESRGDSSRTKPRVSFEDYPNVEGAKQTGGAIFEAELDLSHPIAFGFTNKKLAIYRNNNTIMERTVNPSGSPLVYTEKPWICGYVHRESLKRISNSSAINVAYEGSGRVVMFSDNPNFRATWYGTNKLFLNALFFGANINSGGQFSAEE